MEFEFDNIHRSMSHPRPVLFFKYLRRLGAKQGDWALVQEIYENCVFCRAAGRLPGRPQVALPRALRKNFLVATDNFFLPRAAGLGALYVD